MKTQWIVVADVTEARIYATQPGQAPALVEDVQHPDGHKRNQDFNSDRPGQAHAGGTSQPQSLAQRGSPAETERDRFAAHVGELLERAHEGKRFDELALVAAPKLLGDLRKHLGNGTKKAVVVEIPHGLMHDTVDDLVKKVREARGPVPIQ